MSLTRATSRVGLAGPTRPLVAHDASLVGEEVDAAVGQVVAEVLLQLFSHHGSGVAARRANDGHVAYDDGEGGAPTAIREHVLAAVSSTPGCTDLASPGRREGRWRCCRQPA